MRPNAIHYFWQKKCKTMQYLPSEINGSNSVKESAFNLVVWRKIQAV
jgi:hypothetical protein